MAFKNCIDIVNEWVKIPFHGVNDEIFLLSLLTTTALLCPLERKFAII